MINATVVPKDRQKAPDARPAAEGPRHLSLWRARHYPDPHTDQAMRRLVRRFGWWMTIRLVDGRACASPGISSPCTPHSPRTCPPWPRATSGRRSCEREAPGPLDRRQVKL